MLNWWVFQHTLGYTFVVWLARGNQLCDCMWFYTFSRFRLNKTGSNLAIPDTNWFVWSSKVARGCKEAINLVVSQSKQCIITRVWSFEWCDLLLGVGRNCPSRISSRKSWPNMCWCGIQDNGVQVCATNDIEYYCKYTGILLGYSLSAWDSSAIYPPVN